MSSNIEELREFTANNILNILHNSIRLQGGNDFTSPVPLDGVINGNEEFGFEDPQAYFNSEEGSYYLGLLSASVIMIVFWVIWLCMMATACCCSKIECFLCSNTCKQFFLLLSLGMSIIAWFISIEGNSLLQEGITTALGSAEDLGEFTLEGANILQSILDLENDVTVAVNNLQFECGAVADDAGVDLSGLPTGQVIEDTLGGPQAELANVDPTVGDAVEQALPALEQAERIYVGFTTTIIVFLIIFGCTTTFKLLFDSNRCGEGIKWAITLNDLLTKFGCCIFASCGFGFACVIWWLCIILAPLVTLGADLCIPDLTTNILDELSVVLGVTDTSELCDLSDFDSLSEEQIAGSLLCHYSTCEGNNIVFEYAGIEVNDDNNITIGIVQEVLTEVETARDDLIAGLLANNLTADLGVACSDSVDVAIDLSNNVVDLVGDGILLVSCDTLTPVYRSLVDDAWCNGIVSGLGVIFVTWTTGIAGMMMTMYCFCLLNYSKDPEPAYDYNSNDIYRVDDDPPPGITDDPPVAKEVEFKPPQQDSKYDYGPPPNAYTKKEPVF